MSRPAFRESKKSAKTKIQLNRNVKYVLFYLFANREQCVGNQKNTNDNLKERNTNKH